MEKVVRPDVYARAHELISEAYALPQEQRDEFVARACSDNSALRTEVGWLIGVMQSPDDGFLNAGLSAPPLATDELKIPTPRNYTLVRKVGEGGMGTVYLAERVDGEFRHSVALKLLNLSALHTPAILAGFLSERQILARLNHPNISHLVDAGALSDGRPFLAMEFVEGQRIDQYCVDRNLSVRECLAMFLKVCAAVHYAHQQLIIHRDIKPANILVTASGEPKLLDFGIARLLRAPNVATASLGGAHMMTLAYPSPEQIEGKPLSTATDEYSLAVTLYQLLSGTHPWGDVNNPAAIVSNVSRSEPLAPSLALRLHQTGKPRRRWFKRGWRAALPRDLDAVVLKALRKKPEDRYLSVAAFADDITAFLKGQPVKARRGNAFYWMRRFVARHVLGVATAIVVLALTIGFIVDRQKQLQRIVAQRNRAESVADLLTSVFSSADPTEAAQPNMPARDALDHAAERLKVELQDQPATRAALLLALGNAYRGLSLTEPAKKQFSDALGIVQSQPDIDPALQVDVLRTVGDFTAKDLGESQSGETLSRQAVAIAHERLRAGDPSRVSAMRDLAVQLVNAKQGGGAEAEKLSREALAEAKVGIGATSRLALRAKEAVGFVLETNGNLPAAQAVYEQLIPELETQFGVDAYPVLDNRNEYARLLLSQRLTALAEPVAIENLRRIEQRFGPNSPHLATPLNTLADLYNRTGREQEAAAAMVRAVDLRILQTGKDNPTLGQDMCNLAYVLEEVHQLDEAAVRAAECVRLHFLPQAQMSGYYKGHALYVAALVDAARDRSVEALAGYEKAYEFISQDPQRNGNALLTAILKACTDLSIKTKDLVKARHYTALFEEQAALASDPGYIRARAAGMRAKIAAADNDPAATKQAVREAWQLLATTKTDCKDLANAIRAFAKSHAVSGDQDPIVLEPDPPCVPVAKPSENKTGN